jgi:Zn-dependent protease with chaperone function
MTLRVWLFIAFAFFVVGCIVRVALKAIAATDDKTEKVALAVITGLLSLISGGVGSFVTGATVQESAKEAGKAAAKVEKNVSTKATKEAAKSAAQSVSGQVSKEVTQAIEAKGSTGTTPKAGTAPKK